MPAARRFPVPPRRARGAAGVATVVAAALLPLIAGGCGSQTRTACGDAGQGGAPPRISTKDAELCESVRIRVADALGRLPGLTEFEAARWRDMTWQWEDADTLAGMLRRVRQDAGDPVADAMARAVDEVQAHSTRPVRAECKDAERCLVRGAALGARIAFDDAWGVLGTIRRAQGGSVKDQERLENAR